MRNLGMFGGVELKTHDVLLDEDWVFIVTMVAGEPWVTSCGNHAKLSYYTGITGTLDSKTTRIFRATTGSFEALLMRMWWQPNFVGRLRGDIVWMNELTPMEEMTIPEIEKILGHRVKITGDIS